MPRENTETIIIIPCFNEEKRLTPKSFIDFLDTNDHVDLLFVNDGSTDGTSRFLKTHFSSHPRIQIFDLGENVGKGEAIRLSFVRSLKMNKYSNIGFWDADLSTPISESARMIEIINSRQNLHFVAGSRWNRLGANIKRSMLRHYLSRVFATCASMIIGMPVYDTQCGSKIFNVTYLSEAIVSPFLSPWLFDIELFIRFKKICLREKIDNWVMEVPVQEWVEVKGSKARLKDFLKAPYELVKIKVHYS